MEDDDPTKCTSCVAHQRSFRAFSKPVNGLKVVTIATGHCSSGIHTARQNLDSETWKRTYGQFKWIRITTNCGGQPREINSSAFFSIVWIPLNFTLLSQFVSSVFHCPFTSSWVFSTCYSAIFCLSSRPWERRCRGIGKSLKGLSWKAFRRVIKL